jgi:hypothetical protein
MSLVILFSLVSCGKSGSGSASSGATMTPKNFFSKWTHKPTGFSLDFSSGSFYSIQTFYTYLPITQEWIDALNSAGRNTTGLVAGTKYICELDIYFVGTQSSGSFATNHDDINTPAHNACLEWDSNCVIGVCNASGDHTFTKTDNKLTVDYFGSSDYGLYGVDTLE